MNQSNLPLRPLDEEAAAAGEIWTAAMDFLRQLRVHYPLFFVFLFLFLLLGVAMYVFVDPTYTAYATIGAPSQSPVDALLAGGGGGAGQSVKRLLGGATGSSSNDPFQEYQQVLRSSRLSQELAQNDNFLPELFGQDWDPVHKRWRSGPPRGFMVDLKRALHRPVVEHPDADTLGDELGRILNITPVTSSASSLLSLGGSGYMTVSFKYKDAHKAEALLNAILSRADEIIRQDQRRDVLARISFLESELPTVTQTDVRQSMIQILSDQEELKTMIIADKRFAFTMIDPPHASPTPSFPPRPSTALLLLALAAFGSFAVTVFFEARSRLVRRVLAPFAVRGRSRKPNRPIEHGQQLPQAR